MPLWGSVDAASNAVKFDATDKKTPGSAASGNSYGNVTAGQFRTNQALGIFGANTTEIVGKGVHPGWIMAKQGMGPITALAPNTGGTSFANLAVGSITGPTGTTQADFIVLTTNSTGGILTMAPLGSTQALAAPGVNNQPSGLFANVASLTVVQPANSVLSVVASPGGTGYSNTDIVRISNSTAGVVNAWCSLTTNSTGGITAVNLVTGGRNFVNATAVAIDVYKADTFVASTGSGATITPTMKTGGASLAVTGLVTLGGRANRKQYETLVALGSMSATGSTLP